MGPRCGRVGLEMLSGVLVKPPMRACEAERVHSRVLFGTQVRACRAGNALRGASEAPDAGVRGRKGALKGAVWDPGAGV